MPQPVTGYGKAALARYLMRAELYPLEPDQDATLTGRGRSPTALHLTGRGGVQVTQTFSGASSGQSKGMNAAEILASVAGVLEKAQGWSDEQKLQAASEILHVLKREGHLVLDPDEWEFVPSRAGGFLRGPFPLGHSDWAIAAGH